MILKRKPSTLKCMEWHLFTLFSRRKAFIFNEDMKYGSEDADFSYKTF